MTATLDGLQALISDHGFEHRDPHSIRISSKAGCPLWSILLYSMAVRLSHKILGMRVTTQMGAPNLKKSKFRQERGFSSIRRQKLNIHCLHAGRKLWKQDITLSLDIFTTHCKLLTNVTMKWGENSMLIS